MKTDSASPTNVSPITERTVTYSLRLVRLYRTLAKDGAGQILGRQLLRSGTSVGANVHEAQGAQSRADFIAKMSIAHKEAREAAYWLRLIAEAELVPPAALAAIQDETSQIVKILSSILLSTKHGKKTAASAPTPNSSLLIPTS